MLILSLIIINRLHWSNSSKREKYKYIDTLKNYYIKDIKHNFLGFPLNKQVCYENLSLLHELMSKLDINFWISDGTALGFRRDKDFIDHDDDVDIGFFSEDENKFWNNIHLFKSKGFSLAEIRSDNTFVVLIRKGEKIDIDITGAGLVCDQCNNNPCENILPYLESFDNIDIKGKKYNIPKEDYLIYKYGEDWKTPIIKKHFF